MDKDIKSEMKNQRIVPPGRVWNRLERRLDQDKGKISRKTMVGWIGAAAMVLLVALCGIVISLQTEQGSNSTAEVEETLEMVEEERFSQAYASEMNKFYNDDSWKNIREGKTKKLVPNL